MEEKQIKKYANVMQELGLSALEIEEQGCRLRLERGAGASQAAAPSAAAAVSSDAAQAAAATQDICSPMVGVFYRAPAENAAPFVQVGDCIHKGDVLCLIEAMKLMNEIVAEYDGVITESAPRTARSSITATCCSGSRGLDAWIGSN